MTPEQIETMFTRHDGAYHCARWGRPIAPIVFGVTDQMLPLIKGAIEAVVGLAGHNMTETDPELGANLMMFFFREWDELLDVPDLGRLIPDLGPLVQRLKDTDASQYRAFRFQDDGGIQMCFVFLRMKGAMADLPAEALALGQAVQSLLLWSETAFDQTSPLAMVDGHAVLRPEIADLIRAVYDPVMPISAQEPSHALRLSARIGVADQG